MLNDDDDRLSMAKTTKEATGESPIRSEIRHLAKWPEHIQRVFDAQAEVEQEKQAEEQGKKECPAS